MISFLPKRAILEKVTRQLRRARAAVESFDKRDRDGGVFLLIHAIIIHHHKLNLDESMLAHMHEHLFAFGFGRQDSSCVFAPFHLVRGTRRLGPSPSVLVPPPLFVPSHSSSNSRQGVLIGFQWIASLPVS